MNRLLAAASRPSAVAVSAAIALTLALVPDAVAMPGFARKYRQSCNVCHSPFFPKLKAYGEDFAGGGFVLPEGEPRYATIDTGDDLLALPREVPIGLRMDLYAGYEHDQEANNDFKVPYVLKILSGGPIADGISYYFYFLFSEHGEIAGLEDALVMFTDMFGSGLNLTVGQFAVHDPMFKSELRLTYENYMLYRIKPSLSEIDLNYDRGLMLDYGFDWGLDIFVAGLNGNGIGEGEGVRHLMDKDDWKSVFGRISQDLPYVRLGAFGYWGREDDRPDDASPHETNEVWYYGGDVTISIPYLELNGMYLRRTDSNPGFVPDGEDATSWGFMVEAVLITDGDDSRWGLTALYNHFESDWQESGVEVLDYRSASLNATWLLARNVKLTAEYTFFLEERGQGEGHRALLGVVAGL